MPAKNTHQCPAVHCTRRVSADMLMCRAHWFMVPKPERDAVWAAWHGPGVGAPEHTEAITAAVEAVNGKIRAILREMQP